DPLVTTGTGSNPDTVAIALCTSQPIGYLAANATVGNTTITVDSATAAAVDNASKSLMFINDTQPIRVNSITGTSITVDTDPTTPGPQAMTKAYHSGVPICRVDVITFSVDTTNNQLLQNSNQGAGNEVVMDGITNMKIVTDSTGVKPKYTVTLTAQSS